MSSINGAEADSAITRFTLPNGLRWVHHHDPEAVMAVMNVLYNVGARDERPDRTGMAHLFEHLMFGGSAHVPSFDQAMERAGGSDNAWTNNDFTNFYDILPAVNFETAFRLESDRMLSPLLTDEAIRVQKGVVTEEFKQTCLNRPYGDLQHHLRKMAFDSHPYRYPTIGESIEQIHAVSREDAECFFFNHYAPNNAVVTTTGNIPAAGIREMAEKWFGTLPRRDIAPRLYPTLPLRITDGPRRVDVSGPVPLTAVCVAYRMPAHGEPGYRELDVLTDILASGRSSRIYRNLVVANELFAHADASILGSDERGLLMLNARLSSDKEADITRAIELLTAQAQAIAVTPPTDEEMERARTRYESELTFSELSPTSRASELAMCEMQGDDPDERVARYRAVTAQAVSKAAADTIRPDQTMTLVYHPRD
ncbi:MAG: insulinase family protein [Candidatus Amulumruptor caecigallinarius]|nr:insulinase family protein [Candidatus Amulumruptor caecigallinarius]MCM1396950.1 insulinase family protein [Candidatus Amulumruptor caecigallinarius]MCM1454769.1 insulinase family protein [bacterium]